MANVYTKIIDIIAPDTALAGSIVNVTIQIQNTYSGMRTITIGASGRIKDGDWLDFNGTHATQNIQPLLSKSFTCSFTMPNKDALIQANSYYVQEDGSWLPDDFVDKLVILSGAPPNGGDGGVPPEEFAGTILGIKLEYDHEFHPIPANPPVGKSVKVYVDAKNDTTVDQRIGIRWIVTDRLSTDAVVVEDYDDWQFGTTSPGGFHTFNGGFFSVDRVGTYYINIGLAMNPSAPVLVDSHYGPLCTLVSEWIALASKTVTIIKSVTGGWVALASYSVTIKHIVHKWIALASTSVIIRHIPHNWIPLATASVSIKAGPPIKKDWVPWVAGIGAAGLAAYAVVKSREK